MVYKFISVKYLLEGLYRDYGAQEELDLWDVIEWAGEALDFIGAHQQYEQKVVDLSIESHRAKLPCDFHSLIAISYEGYPLHHTLSTVGPSDSTSSSTNYLKGVEVDANNFPVSSDEIANMEGDNFYITDNFVVTSMETATITMVYKAVPVDEEGFPRIPDNVYYSKAIKTYCQMMMDRMKWREGKVPQAVYQDSQADWQWFCRGARGAANMPNVDQAEAIKRQWVRLKPNQNQYDSFFQSSNVREMKRLK